MLANILHLLFNCNKKKLVLQKYTALVDDLYHFSNN